MASCQFRKSRPGWDFTEALSEGGSRRAPFSALAFGKESAKLSEYLNRLLTTPIRSRGNRLPPKGHMIEYMTAPDQSGEDFALEGSVRPGRFEDFAGQQSAKDNLKIYIKAASNRGESLDHILLHGPPGLGKTTLAGIIAHEMGVNFKATSGPLFQSPVDLSGVLTNLNEGDVLFIDEIHRVSRSAEEYLYPAMEDFVIDIVIDQGPKAKSVRLNLDKFTLVGATTRMGLLTSPLRSRFGIIERVNFYSVEELAHIAARSARILGVDISSGGALEIARRSRGAGRVVNRLLRRIRDFAEVRALDVISAHVASDALDKLNIDKKGLDEMDRSILLALINKFEGRATGLSNLAASVGEEEHTIIEVHEPWLIREGYLERTPRGRRATRLAYTHLITH